jgi:rhamnogalacturonan acetylesterase
MLSVSNVVSLLALAAMAFAAPSGELQKRAPTVYLAGDSTMARANGATTGKNILMDGLNAFF